MAGSMSIHRAGIRVCLHTENSAVARRMFVLYKSLYGDGCEISVVEHQYKKHKTYVLTMGNILEDIGVVFEGGINLNTAKIEHLLARNCCEKAFVQGAFLGGGSISDPVKNNHVEFVCNLEELANVLLNILYKFNIKAKLSHRKDDVLVYIKEMQSIATLLTLIGAHSSVLEIENIKIIKDARNVVNRQLNCDNANINKTITAAQAQMEDINKIVANGGLGVLPESLARLAQFRLENAEMPMSELAQMLGVSKSCVNHRFNRIKLIAKNIKK